MLHFYAIFYSMEAQSVGRKVWGAKCGDVRYMGSNWVNPDVYVYV